MALLMAGCQSSSIKVEDYVRARFLLESTRQDNYTAVVTLPVSQISIPVKGDALISEYDYYSIEVMEVDIGKCLLFTLNPRAAKAFYQLTVANQGKRMVLLLNEKPIGVRRIEGPIADGRVFMFLETSDENLMKIAEKLKETNIAIQRKLSS